MINVTYFYWLNDFDKVYITQEINTFPYPDSTGQ